MTNTNATRIKELIIELADSYNSEEDLWETYKIVNKGISYLSAKHTMARVKEEQQEE